MRFYKYHALGNSYLIVIPDAEEDALPAAVVRRLCDPRRGIGSDGVLLEAPAGPGEHSRIRIYNPDGREAERSGNGLRIWARYLWDTDRVNSRPFTVGTMAGPVRLHVHDDAAAISVELGPVRFDSRAVGAAGPARNILGEPLQVDDAVFLIAAVSTGNPHCVVLNEEPTPVLARRWGPRIENHPLFPNGVNVQFLEVLDRTRLRIEIWERGAGYTTASGTSACAAAAVARRLGWCDSEVTVVTVGGTLHVAIDTGWHVALRGPVQPVCYGIVQPHLFAASAGEDTDETDVY